MEQVPNMQSPTDHDGLHGSLPSPEAQTTNSELGALSRSGCTSAFVSCENGGLLLSPSVFGSPRSDQFMV